jgi:hypothetical protein
MLLNIRMSKYPSSNKSSVFQEKERRKFRRKKREGGPSICNPICDGKCQYTLKYTANR